MVHDRRVIKQDGIVEPDRTVVQNDRVVVEQERVVVGPRSAVVPVFIYVGSQGWTAGKGGGLVYICSKNESLVDGKECSEAL